MTSPFPVIALAGGGTGGHLFPAEAVARALLARGARPVLITDARAGSFGTGLEQVPVQRIAAAQLGGGLPGKLRGALALARGYLQGRRLLRELEVAGVVGFGGYASAPTCLAAIHRRLPLVLFEANTVLGRANRALATRAHAIAAGFMQLLQVPPAAEGRMVHTGVPVRQAIIDLADQPYQPPREDGPIVLLVTGGSQGARIFAQTVPPALALLPAGLRARLQVQQQVRAEDLAAVQDSYRRTGIAAECQPFFTDMAARLGACHLAIGRAGASTVVETALAGRPAVLVPLPSAMDDHQRFNARIAEQAGAARLLDQADLTPERLSGLLTALLGDPATLAAMSQRARATTPADAADRVARLILTAVGTRAAQPD